jgi:hypothetical protein
LQGPSSTTDEHQTIVTAVEAPSRHCFLPPHHRPIAR